MKTRMKTCCQQAGGRWKHVHGYQYLRRYWCKALPV